MNILRSKKPYSSTNIYNVTASLTTDFPKLTLNEKIEAARLIIFTFDYPTPDNVDKAAFKEYFERMFITHFIDDYFKAETFEKWHLKFYSKMLEIMPTYNAMLSHFFYEDKDKLFLSSSESTTTSTGKQTTENKATNKSTQKNTDFKSKYPSSLKTAGSNAGAVKYANDGDLFNGENNGESSANGKTDSENTSTTKSTSGNILDGVIKFNSAYKNIFTNLLKEFNPLFSAIIHY